MACSCMDCEESCPLPDKIPEPQKPFQLVGLDVLTLSSAILFCFLLSTFLGFLRFKGNLSRFKYLLPIYK